MAVLTVRNVPEAVHRAIRMRAAEHGRSTEAEVRDILENAVRVVGRTRLGDCLAEIGRKAGLTNEDVAILERARDNAPAKPMDLE